jgi:GNAT superfamily N-acetyltransferase
MAQLRIDFDPHGSEAEARFIEDSINLHNVAATGRADYMPLRFLLRPEQGGLLGGVTGYLWGGWLHVQFLWVAPAARGAGHGTRLMDTAENHALERGCLHATLETFSFQARPFYERRGYQVVGTVEGYPPGHAKYLLRKALG